DWSSDVCSSDLEGGHVGGRRVLGRRRLLREGGRCRRGGRHLLRGGLLAHRRGLGGVVVTVAAAAGQTERGEGEGGEEHGRSARHTILRVRARGGAELFWGSSDPTSTPVTEVAPAGGEGTAPSPPAGVPPVPPVGTSRRSPLAAASSRS